MIAERFADAPLRVKLTGIILACTLGAMGLGLVLVAVSERTSLRRDMVERTELVARVVADGSVGDLAFEDRAASTQTLARLATVPSMEHAVLLDAGGHVFSQYNRSGGQPPEGATDAAGFGDGYLRVEQPIHYKGERYGTLRVYASTTGLEAKLRRQILVLLGSSAVLVALAVVAALRLQRVITGPLVNLADTARRVSEEHDYSVRVGRAGRDEVGQLCDGFNEMLAQIERREAEREAADRRTREKSQFLANMSHELRTPLNSIIGFSEILLARLDGKVAVRELKFLQNIHTSGQHLLGIINDILDLSKVEAGRMELNPEPVAIGSVLDSVATIMRGYSTKRQVAIEVVAAPDLPSVEADPVKLKQVLYNLASNAVKYSPPGSVVRIQARRVKADASPLAEDGVEVAVADQGPGIDPKDHERVFQEFRQSSAQRAEVEGTGLGLALVRRFVELHRGIVRLDSALGHGSTFTVLLPLSLQPVLSGSGATALRVLVVEDEPASWRPIAQALVDAGYAPLWARSGEEAVALARSVRPAAVTLDVLLGGGMDGWGVLRALKSDEATRSIPVVMVTVSEQRALGAALGAADYFRKPVDPDDLVRRLTELAPPGGRRKPRILLVDDDPLVHDTLGPRLVAAGYQTDHARSGSEGLARATAMRPSIVLLDLLMEGMDGFETALRLQADPRTKGVPIVIVTAKDVTEEDRIRLRGTIVGLVGKGEMESSLGATLESVLGAPTPPPA